MASFLFITDLDNTLVGDDLALQTLNQKLSQHRQEYSTKIVYATGRSLYLYQQIAQEKSLLPPDALITSVGTEIYFNPSEEKFDWEWAEMLSQGWDRDEICAIASHFVDFLVPQPRSEQNAFKVSYYITEQAAAEVLPRLESTLSQHGLQTKLVYSAGQDLDILPSSGDKGLAVQFLRQKLEIDAQQTVVCGDSGNDIALFRGEERGIIVGNAKPELRQWYQENQTDYRYFAQAYYANGILEGLQYFNFL
ncbi:sucrose-6F-phosphate phosphohydrolase [Pleurocapsa sp. PCC 7327]|uniref:sucrose-phosphate phosphatase n=1 Tax=Pleurocapsa sp. PCC 7327 TaxID=118163 RepID=UPI00029FF42E|nr:sucrose-phosphate phosphatase [Pleurocapsa sp. PCC 7327]AFY78464.1 sucrose-6F-phosphate phosphohydrolase [Pleurocapsa sp. PCC 7327]